MVFRQNRKRNDGFCLGRMAENLVLVSFACFSAGGDEYVRVRTSIPATSFVDDDDETQSEASQFIRLIDCAIFCVSISARAGNFYHIVSFFTVEPISFLSYILPASSRGWTAGVLFQYTVMWVLSLNVIIYGWIDWRLNKG